MTDALVSKKQWDLLVQDNREKWPRELARLGHVLTEEMITNKLNDSKYKRYTCQNCADYWYEPNMPKFCEFDTDPKPICSGEDACSGGAKR